MPKVDVTRRKLGIAAAAVALLGIGGAVATQADRLGGDPASVEAAAGPLSPGTKVSYVISGKVQTGVVLVYIDAGHVLVSQDSTSTTQRILPVSVLTDLTPPPTTTAATTATTATTTTTAPDTQPPSVPQGQAFGTITQTSVRLDWSPSTDNVGVTGYRVYRDDVPGATTTQTTYTFTGLVCGTTYKFGVGAFDAAGNISNVDAASGTTATAACDPPPVTTTTTTTGTTTTPPPTTGSANLWVDASGGTCARSVAGAAYSDASACTWQAAYSKAVSNDLILVKGGSYGDVTMPTGRTITGITFRTADGEIATVRDFENGHINNTAAGISNVSFVGPVKARTFRSDRASNVLVDSWNVDCDGCVNVQIFHLEAATNVVVRNSEIQDNTDNSLIWISGTSLTFEGNSIHDAGLRSGSGAHTECMYVWSTQNLRLTGNHFYHCSVMDVFITGDQTPNGGYIENNIFEQTWSNTGVLGDGLSFHFRNGSQPPTPDPNNWDFRYNTFIGALSISSDNTVGSGGMRVIGNWFKPRAGETTGDAPCGKANTTFRFNVGDCGWPTNPANAGDPNDFPPKDINKRVRPVGAGPDAGAEELQ